MRHIPVKSLLVITVLFLSASAAHVAWAEGWHLQIGGHNSLPASFLLVDKEAQKAHVVKKENSLSITCSFPCTTGQVPGDKLIEDDKKTPEGVYFVGRKVTGLDYNEYGGTAYTLNYPNPVDRLRKKTGYGIWVHSKGHIITRNETVGCIALNLNDLHQVGSSMLSGYPVVVTASASGDFSNSPEQAATAQLLAQKVTKWAHLWSERSMGMFSMYDGPSYSLAQKNENFASFTASKNHLFKILPWVTVTASNVQALPGPGYWVTWFKQMYLAPNLSTEGIRRLYWQQINGEWLIVGMEWIPQKMGLVQNYLKEQEAAVLTIIESWQTAWQQGNLDLYGEFYAQNSIQGKLYGKATLLAHKQELWGKRETRSISLSEPEFSLVSAAKICVSMAQNYTDSSGYSDKGIKHLTFERTGKGWLITNEQWSRR
ncbi:L,D-transpeptidase family protein [Desulfovibrio sp. OttesenSCG-928-F07]|nr:L,D-transpeptidase family protein [Desulfovibrio sp. OttesenSCG-928-F07]